MGQRGSPYDFCLSGHGRTRIPLSILYEAAPICVLGQFSIQKGNVFQISSDPTYLSQDVSTVM